MSDEELRAAYARVTAARRDPDRASCPAPEMLHAAARHEGPERQRLEALDHALACPACRREFEMFRAVEVGRRREEAGGSVPRIRSHRPLLIALAASLLVAVALGPGRSWWDDPASDVVRGTGQGIAPIRPADDATVDAGAPLVFVWRPTPGVGGYVLEVLTPAGVVLASAATADTTATLAPGTLAPGDYRWMVRAATPAGERRTPARRLVVRDAPDA